MTIKVLLQTTIAPTANDWSIDRFSLLAALLRKERDASGQPLFDVTTRDRDPLEAPDSLLSKLDRSDYHQLWLFAVDVGNGLFSEDRRGIEASRARGGGVLVARDHMDLGCSLAQSTFQHFADYNWDPRVGAPSFVDEPPRGRHAPPSRDAGGCASIFMQRCGLARRSFHHLTHRVLSSAQCLYKRPGSLEIARLKPFRKPSVDRRNQFPTLVAATLLRSKPCKCHRCA